MNTIFEPGRIFSKYKSTLNTYYLLSLISSVLGSVLVFIDVTVQSIYLTACPSMKGSLFGFAIN